MLRTHNVPIHRISFTKITQGRRDRLDFYCQASDEAEALRAFDAWANAEGGDYRNICGGMAVDDGRLPLQELQRVAADSPMIKSRQ